MSMWDIASPAWPSRVPGVTMAGFRDRGVAPIDQLLVPHPALTLVLDFGAGQPIVDDAAGRQYRGSMVAGLGLGGAVRGRGENIQCVQIRLSPVVAQAILGVGPADLEGTVVTLDDLWGREAARIREQLSAATSWADRFELADTLLARRYAAGSSIDATVAWAWHRIVATRGIIRIDQLATELGWSRKRLWSRFHAQIGQPPKPAARLVRFDRAAHRLVAGHHPARVAADAGYTDQSHLHRDVMAFTGITPTAVATEPFLTIDDLAWPTATQAART
ncbi:helix-turn-helix domain-containing protein [Nocardia altamirensis]|uniref:helix-turn-helix domain-containing protein n=1 Tax=Nocardia altamirensis TaxID=472158 RepID=UPI000A747099|nr:helix-turn-helix domain-containing protein [Nocardia altamirensis]